MNRKQFISIFFIALLIFVVAQIFLILSPFTRAIFWSAILAFTFYPVYDRLRRHLKPYETVAALSMTVLIFLIVIPPAATVIINVTAQAIELSQAAYTYIREGELEKLIEQIRSVSFIEKIETRVFAWEPMKQNATDFILNSSKAIGNFVASQVGTLTKNIFFVGLNLVLMFFLVFIFLKDGHEIYQFIYQIAPLEEKNKKSIFRQINDTLGAVIRGQLLTSLTQSGIAGLAFWVLGLPVPIFFAVATFFSSMIPVAGAGAIWIPLMIYLFIQKLYVKAFALLFIGTFISTVDNILKPALIGERTKLPYFLLFFGILGGLKVYGLVGVFLAPVMLSLFFALVTIYQEQNW